MILLHFRDSGPFKIGKHVDCSKIYKKSNSSHFFSFGSLSNFIRVVEVTKTIIEDEPNPKNTLDVWKNFIEGIGQEFKNVEILHLTILNFCIVNYRDFIFVKNDYQHVTVECVYKGYG